MESVPERVTAFVGTARKKGTYHAVRQFLAESFINTLEKMAEVAGKQMNSNVKTAGKTLELLRPLPKDLMDAMVKPTGEHKRAGKPARLGKKPAARRKRKEAAAAAAA